MIRNVFFSALIGGMCLMNGSASLGDQESECCAAYGDSASYSICAGCTCPANEGTCYCVTHLTYCSSAFQIFCFVEKDSFLTTAQSNLVSRPKPPSTCYFQYICEESDPNNPCGQDNTCDFNSFASSVAEGVCYELVPGECVSCLM